MFNEEEFTPDEEEEIESTDKSLEESFEQTIKDNVVELDFTFTVDQKVYWTEEEEKAVVDFLWLDESWLKNKIMWEHQEAKELSREVDSYMISLYNDMIEKSKTPNSQLRKNKIFKERLEKPLNKLIENIIFNFKLIRPDVDIKSQEDDSFSFLMTKFSKFDPSEKTKAFSYYGTLVKHYLIGEKKDKYKDQQSHLDYEILKEEVNNRSKYEMHDVSHLDESSKLFKYIIEELKSEIRNTNLSDNDKKVGNAIINIFENHEKINIYSKNNLYQMVKEYTDLQTKDITGSLSRFKSLYKVLKQGYIKKNK